MKKQFRGRIFPFYVKIFIRNNKYGAEPNVSSALKHMTLNCNLSEHCHAFIVTYSLRNYSIFNQHINFCLKLALRKFKMILQ